MTIEASAPRRKLSAILMIDVVGFSRMMGQDEERTIVLIREFHERTQGLVEAHAGRVVDTAAHGNAVVAGGRGHRRDGGRSHAAASTARAVALRA